MRIGSHQSQPVDAIWRLIMSVPGDRHQDISMRGVMSCAGSDRSADSIRWGLLWCYRSAVTLGGCNLQGILHHDSSAVRMSWISETW